MLQSFVLVVCFINWTCFRGLPHLLSGPLIKLNCLRSCSQIHSHLKASISSSLTFLFSIFILSFPGWCRFQGVWRIWRLSGANNSPFDQATRLNSILVMAKERGVNFGRGLVFLLIFYLQTPPLLSSIWSTTKVWDFISAPCLLILELNPWAFCLQLNYNEFCNLMNSRSRRKEEEEKIEEERRNQEERGEGESTTA